MFLVCCLLTLQTPEFSATDLQKTTAWTDYLYDTYLRDKTGNPLVDKDNEKAYNQETEKAVSKEVTYRLNIANLSDRPNRLSFRHAQSNREKGLKTIVNVSCQETRSSGGAFLIQDEKLFRKLRPGMEVILKGRVVNANKNGLGNLVFVIDDYTISLP